MKRGDPPTLARLLMFRMTIVAGASTLALLALFTTRYLLDLQSLAYQTLESQAASIAAAVEAGEDPSEWPHYQNYPTAYGFRVFDKLLPVGQRMLAGGNTTLLPPLREPEPGEFDQVLHLRTGFDAVPLPDDLNANSTLYKRGWGRVRVQPLDWSDDRWMLTSRETSATGRALWVQTIMLGDPAWLWLTALYNEILGRIAIPVALLVPMITLAMLLVVQRALRPIEAIAREARILSVSAARGEMLRPLSADGLTRELDEMVGAMNIMLGALDTTMQHERAFAADAAHELRTPLAVLRLEVAELPKGSVATRLDEQLARLAHLIGQLLRFAQAERAMAADLQIVDVTEVARSICEDMAPAALAHQQELAFVAVEQPVILFGNPVLLGVALRNLVENAMRVSPRGGTVTVSVTPDGLTVEDDGPGIPDTDKANVFDRLWQADRRREGAGIGLALVRRISQLHEGRVWVEDRAGGGARFVMHLVRSATERSPSAVNPSRGTKRETVF